MARKMTLGRNLNALLSTNSIISTSSAEQLRHVPLAQIVPGKYQPRTLMCEESLNELAQSIKQQGIIQPIVVRDIADNQYEIVAGERRWRAARLAGLLEIPAVVRAVPDEAALAIALIENVQREDLNALEEAQALQRLLTEFGLTHEAIAKAVGKSRTTVTNLLRLLQLDPEVKQLLEDGKLDMGHARALLAVAGVTQLRIAKIVVAKQLSVRETERLIRQQQTKPKRSLHSNVDRDVLDLQNQISECLAAKVLIQHNSQRGKGKLVIHYSSIDELEGIIERIE